MSQIIADTYEIIEKLGAGGGGNVYLARHLRLGKEVVLKADKRVLSARKDLLRREVDVLKELKHPYIPRVYDFFSEDGITYTAMEYIEGESLDKPLKRGEKFSQPQVIRWALELLDALSYLHSPIHGTPPRGYVHSDIKPANIMRMPDGDICLIDFNISLALGEEHVIGCSAGYASPEHYGLDFSFSSGTGNREKEEAEEDRTLTILSGQEEWDEELPTLTLAETGSQTSIRKRVVPDVRSDIYSVGAVLYHLLGGRRPSKNAQEVKGLSEKEFSPQIVKIISKAMNPNPDLRYQTAAEMRKDFLELRENDPRVRSWKRRRKAAGIVFSILIIGGVFTSFTGLKRMQTEENWLKQAEYSRNALEEGNAGKAVVEALRAFPKGQNIFTPSYTAQAQEALTSALGVYDLEDGYKAYETLELPSEVLYLVIAPDGKTAVGLYEQTMAVFDTETADVITELPAEDSALSEAEYLDSDTIIYAGKEGITAYSISKDTVLWKGEQATGICISADGSTVAAVYKEQGYADIYDAATGNLRQKVDFGGRSQSVAVHDSFANPQDDLFAVNKDGSRLGVSFADGSLEIFDLSNSADDLMLMDQGSGYHHFEGGFSGPYFAFSASNEGDSVCAVVDTDKEEQMGGFQDQTAFGVKTDERGIYVQTENLLVKLDPLTGDQTPLVTMSESILRFAVSETGALAVTKENFQFFDERARKIAEYKKDSGSELIALGGETAMVGSSDSGTIRILKYESHPETEIFSYDPSYEHAEARLSADEKTVMLFSYQGFRLYRIEGEQICKVEVPDAEEVYDQQFVREGAESHLEVIYNDGTVKIYSARDGTLLREEKREKPDEEMKEEFYTDHYRIESPLHGTPVIYEKETDRKVAQLEEDAYLTYVTQVKEGIVLQYVTAGGECYGKLLNEECEPVAELPNLCDVFEDTLMFDYPVGELKISKIYGIKELIEIAQNQQEEEKGNEI